MEEANKISATQRFINSAKELHDADNFQKFFGAVIMGSFTISLIQTEMVSEPSSCFHETHLSDTDTLTKEGEG